MAAVLPPTESELCGSGGTPNKGAFREAQRKFILAYRNLFGGAGTPAGARDVLGAQLEAGAVMHFARNTAPNGWLKANGALVSRTTYADLFAAIGTTYGAGNGTTTFALPELRGEFLRAWDDGRGVDTGRAFGSTQADDLKSHLHVQNLGIAAATFTSAAGTGIAGTTNNSNTSSVGGTETRPRNIAMLVCIKY